MVIEWDVHYLPLLTIMNHYQPWFMLGFMCAKLVQKTFYTSKFHGIPMYFAGSILCLYR